MTPANVDAAAAAVLSWFLTYAIHSTILLAAAAIAARWLVDRHAWLDLVWKTALIAPLVTASLHLDPIAMPVGDRWGMPGGTVVTDPVTAVYQPLSGAPAATPPVTAGRMLSPRTDHAVATDSPVAASEARLPWQPVAGAWRAIAAAAWLVIAIGAVVRYGVRLRRLYRALGGGTLVTPDNLLDIIDGLGRSANQRRAIRVTTSPVCPVPLALVGRRIVLPERFVRELDADQQHAAIAHEMAHVFRRDPAWRVVAEILERVLFFQPLNRLARARLCDAAEFLCDEWAVRQTGSPLALARCLSVIASWWTPSAGLSAGVSAMARSESVMVRRVTCILEEPAHRARPRLLWLAFPVALVAVAAPRVEATQPPASVVTPLASPVAAEADVGNAGEQRKPQRVWTAAEIAAARAKLRVHRSARPADPLEDRWRQALADAARLGFGDFWIVYTFHTPTHAGDLMMSDSRDGISVTSSGELFTQGPPLTALFNSAVPLEGGNVAVLLHFRDARADAIDRAGYRTATLGFDFGQTPVFWLGDAPESQSFARVESLFGQVRTEKIQTLLIELASVHANTDVVAPFLTRLVDPSNPPAIRREAAEGFDHHHDPRSIEVLLRVARTDPDSSVRAEAAETIGEVQTPQAIPALNDLIQSTDPVVRHEAAEAYAAQPAARAIPAIERVIASSEHADVLSEVIEALGELEDPAVLPLLLQTANTHRSREAQRKAVETLGEIDAPGVVEALTRILWDHRDPEVQREAIEALGELSDERAVGVLRDAIARHPDTRVRRKAEEQLRERR